MIDSIISYFESIDPILGALYASLFTWIVTALGASLMGC
jgi:ZIP family zinc transporter